MSRTPLIPAELTYGPFRSADALRAGLTERQLRSACWRRLCRDVYVLRALPLTSELRFEALRLVLPLHAEVTGLTAAWLYGAWRRPPPGALVPLHLATPVDGPTFARSGVLVGRRELDEADVIELDGIRLTSPERTCFELMRRSTLVEAVVFADAFLHRELVTQAGLMRYADERPHWRFVRHVREAVLLSHPGAESPMETRLRMVIVLGGLPCPEVNLPLHGADGRFLGRPDLLYLWPLFGIEYDGSYHGEGDQRDRDNRRENGLVIGHVPLLRYGPTAVYRQHKRIVTEVEAMRAGRLVP